MSSLVLPPWPEHPPQCGAVMLRGVTEADIAMARELSTDPYVPATGSLPANATEEQAEAWVRRQQGRHGEGKGFSFTIVDTASSTPVGHCGLWLGELGDGRGSAGYSISPSARGRGLAADALGALTDFGWTIADLHRIALYIEPWNTASICTAERAGYQYEGLLHSHHVINSQRRDMLIYAALRPPANDL